jgi:hypothetical protein
MRREKPGRTDLEDVGQFALSDPPSRKFDANGLGNGISAR